MSGYDTQLGLLCCVLAKKKTFSFCATPHPREYIDMVTLSMRQNISSIENIGTLPKKRKHFLVVFL